MDTIVCKEQVIKTGDTVYLAYDFRGKTHIGKFTVHTIALDVPRGDGTTWSNVRFAPVYSWDGTQLEIRDGYRYLDINPETPALERMLRTEEEWLNYMKERN